jgi:tripartite-type tricarboxylate transporter receptor subunit TctC
MRKFVALVITGGALLLAGTTHARDTFPTKPIRILVGFGVGGGTDVLSRDIGAKITENWGQTVIVDNRPGAGGTIASEILARSSPDGYTLGMVAIGHAFAPSFYTKLPYDTLKDFAGITVVADVPQVLVVSPTLRVKSMRELIELAKSRQLNWASAGFGSSAYIIGEYFNLAAGIKVVHVPYKTMSEALMNTIGDHVQFVFSSATASVGLVKSGKMIALAVSTKERIAALPDVPTMSQAGMPNFDFGIWYGLVAPARTPKAVKDKLSKEVARILALPDVAERLVGQGATARWTTPEEFDEIIRRDVARLAKLVKETGIRAE